MSLIEEIRAVADSRYAREQAGRFLRLTAAGLAAQLVTVGTGHLGSESVAAMVVGVVELAWRQWAPTVPWSLVAAKLHHAAAQPTTPAAPAAPVVPQPPAAAE